jgi:hypothetical protein
LVVSKKKGIAEIALEKLLPSPKEIVAVLRKVLFSQDKSEPLPKRNEFKHFHSLAKDVSDYNPEPDNKEGYCIIRYQVQYVDK